MEKEWLVVGMSTLLQDIEHQNLQEDRTEILKYLVLLCLHTKPAPTSEVECYCLKSSVFGMYICGLLAINMERKPPKDNMHGILGGEGRKRLRCPNQKENNVNSLILPLSFFKEKNGENEKYIKR